MRRSLKRFLSIFCLVMVSFLMNFVYVKPTAAQVPPLHLKVEVSKDGIHWYNYGGSESGDLETLAVDPGDVVIIRLKVWNSGAVPLGAALDTGTILHSAFVDSVSNINLNADGQGQSFVGDYFENTGVIGVNLIAALSSETSHYESVTARLTLDDSFPAGETVIVGAAGISGLLQQDEPNENQDQNQKPLTYFQKIFFPSAYAIGNLSGYIQYSTSHISINGGLPDTGANL